MCSGIVRAAHGPWLDARAHITVLLAATTMSLARTLTSIAMTIVAQSGAIAATSSVGNATDPDFFDLSLEQLMDVVVTSVSKREQLLSNTAAAVHVITAEDIRRSGATNLPEALRLAPGVQVAQFSNNRWSVSIRGFGGRYANKLLVLQDGRSLYTPLYSGVFWEFQDIPLETIERIEIVRGPGASIWGANAVNGVINIITRSARDAPGGQLAVSAGDSLRGSLFASRSLEVAPDTHLEVHAKAQYVSPSSALGDDKARDFWRTRQAGFRADRKAGDDAFRLQGSVRNSAAGDELTQGIPGVDPAPNRYTSTADTAYVLGRWEHLDASGTTHALQSYFEYSDSDLGIASEQRHTFDVEYQQQRSLGNRHQVVWGAGWRYSEDRVRGSAPYSRFNDERDRTNLFSLFAQDEITLVPERWTLTLGSRLEHHDYPDFTFQPNARLLFTPDARHSLWASVARAARTPSRGERSATARLPARQEEIQFPGAPGPSQIYVIPYVTGSTDFRTEELDALDVGWRTAWSRNFSTEVAAYHYRYDHLRATVPGTQLIPSGLRPDVFLLPTMLTNAFSPPLRARFTGLELSADWHVTPDWRLQSSYSMMHLRVPESAEPTEFSENTPQRIFSLRSAFQPTANVQWDVWLRHTSSTNTFFISPQQHIPAYWAVDMRLAWQANKALELSLVGQNLFDSRHLEAINEPLESPLTEVERSVYLRADFRF